MSNGKQKNEWLVKDIEFNVSDEVRQNIEDDKIVPEKLKKAKRTKLTFASKIEENKIVKLSSDESVLFTYLPTYEKQIKDAEVPIIYDENKNLIPSTSANPVYFQPSEDDKNLLTFDDFYFLNPELNDICQEDSEIKECLQALGVQKFNPVQIIKDRIRKGIYKLPQNYNYLENHLSHIRFIFKYRKNLTDIEYPKLHNLQILAKQKDDDTYYILITVKTKTKLMIGENFS